MIRIARLLAATALAATTLSGPAAAQTGEVVKETHGDWNIVCAAAGSPCVMQQEGKGPDGSVVIDFRVRKVTDVTLPDGTSVTAAIQIAAPLGVLLLAGVQVKIDGNEARTAPFEVCGPSGCIVRQPMSADFLAELKGGSKAAISIYAVPQQLVETSISLSGFTAAFNALEP